MAIKDNFTYFSYFYKYLGYRIFVTFVLSLLVGLLDGIGLALFIPLLQLVSGSETASEDGFITDFVIDFLGIVPSLPNILLLIFVFFGLKAIVKFAEGYLTVLYQQFFMRKIRITNIDLLNDFDFLNFSRSDVGRIQNTFSGEVNRVNSAFRYYFKSFQFGVLVLVYLAMAFTADPVFALMVSIGGIGTNFLFKFLYKRTKYFSRKLTSQTHVFHGLLLQKVSLFKYLKTTGLNSLYSGKLKQNILGLERTQRRIGVVDALLHSSREPVVILVVIIAIYLQIVLFNENIGVIIYSLLLLYRALTFFMALQEHWNFFLGTSGSLENLESFTEELKEGKEKNGNVQFSGLKKMLTLEKVCFRYGSTKVLEGINLEIRKNETLAVVGTSGSGKSTLMNLISGLLNPTDGKLLVDNIPIQDLDLNEYRKHIGYIGQEAPIFNDSIFNNITFWAEKSDENLRNFNKAIEKAAIKDFILELSEKEDTFLGHNGINLSGGQKQRISIARELYKEVDLLLMDEATSSLDSETEAVIQQNIEKLRGSYTIIVIAHRLATIKNSDRIILLQNGKITAEGSFNELIEESESFREMIRLQNL